MFNFIKKLILHIWQLRRQFVKYFVIGFSGVILDLATLFIFKEYFALRPVVAVVINQILIITYIFLLNKFWTFKAKGITRDQLVRFLLIAFANYIFAVIWMWFFNEILGYNYLLTRLANIIISVSWNFLIYKHWVYK